ncbi:MAG: transposase [Dehalococcoidia bacterium]
MDHIRGLSRNQLTLFPEALDDYISQENPVRFIDAYVDSLDLHQLGFRHATLHETGRPPYHPADLLKLYLYGYLNRVRSSRQLEREAHRNVEVMWLLRRLTPDFKTIADFRRDNRQAIRNVSREFTLFCRKLDLFSGDLVVIDGSKFKAVNRRDRNFTKKQLKHLIQKLDEDLLDEMERRVLESPEKMKKMKLRKRLAEHPFGTIKHHWDQGRFLTRKLPNVRAEMALTVLAYNIKRAIKILGVQRMIEALA